MTNPDHRSLGLGAMGSALAAALLDAGHPTTVWNRIARPGRALGARGASRRRSVEARVAPRPLVVACLFDHASVHEILDPVARGCAGARW